MKTLTQPSTGKIFKMGRNRPIANGPRLSLKNYLMRTGLPTPPSSCDYTGAAAAELANIYGNDTYGDCVIAGMGHIEGVLTANAGNAFMLGDEEIIWLYGKIGGYVPGDPSTDQGCDEETALNFWQQKGLGNQKHKIKGYLAVNAEDIAEVRLALYLFENLMFGMELPDAWISPFPSESGFTWDVAGAPDQNNGHCVISGAYSPDAVTIATWGMLGYMTNAAVAEYAANSEGGQLFTVLSQDAISKATLRAPNGFAWNQLAADFASIGG